MWINPRTKKDDEPTILVFPCLQLKKVEDDIRAIVDKPENLLLEALHEAGYQGALGRPLVAPETAVLRLNPETLHRFVEVRDKRPKTPTG